jgi:hypothetical protein
MPICATSSLTKRVEASEISQTVNNLDVVVIENEGLERYGWVAKGQW